MFVSSRFKGVIPEIVMTSDEYELAALVNREIKDFIDNLDHCRFVAAMCGLIASDTKFNLFIIFFRLRDGIRNILSISRHGNQYIQSQQPWVLLKGTDEEK